ncbi:MAG TPA: hypothetical protein PLH11_13170, partial [Gemmobacter sp.]|nr:hypothetical protein [Gemmobacter sp.]
MPKSRTTALRRPQPALPGLALGVGIGLAALLAAVGSARAEVTVTGTERLGLVFTEGQVITAHGISSFGDLKYPADFKHLDYVNPT